MPRPLRIQLEDELFHVATRAVFGAQAYIETADRVDFLELLWETVKRYEWRCQAYCLMGTHYHLIVKTLHANLSAGMQWLNGRYAQRFNWRHPPRHGHLFGRRFGSVHITSDRQLHATHRYVARNPVRSGLCEKPSQWRWSSVRAIAGLAPIPDFLDRDAVLALFDAPRDRAADAFLRFVSQRPPDDEFVVDPLSQIVEAEPAGV